MALRDRLVFLEEFDIVAAAAFILENKFQRVALQFPDELLKHSVAVSSELNIELLRQSGISAWEEAGNPRVRLFVMADTTFGSCCADEVAAMHVDAQAIVHYGHTCLSRTSRLPVWFVFGRASINPERCAMSIIEYMARRRQPVLVMFGLEYLYSAHSIQERVRAIQGADLDITFASIPSQLMIPSITDDGHSQGCQIIQSSSKSPRQDNTLEERIDTCCQGGKVDDCNHDSNDDIRGACCSTSGCTSPRDIRAIKPCNCNSEVLEFKIGGLKWVVPRDKSMEDYIIIWIGGDSPGLTNTSLIFNSSTVVRYDNLEEKIATDVINQSRLLQRRYYLVERAKDANVVGIVVGTLGVAGYAKVIQSVRRMVEAAGKKAYTLVIGKPNPSKLANFPECEVFVLVACPQTALLESKDYLAPVITPFEAELAFLEGVQWTGAYQLEFASELDSHSIPQRLEANEPRFSFFTGGYIGKGSSQDQDVEDSSRAVVISHVSQHALQLQSEPSSSIIVTDRSILDIRSGAEYLASRTYQGLDINQEGPDGPTKASLAIIGRRGRAAAYKEETI